MKFKLTEIHPGIFLAEFNSQYDMAMTFLRYQEFYESANPKFKGNQFTIIDFMEWYSKGHKGVFTYPKDWTGFNIPMDVVCQLQRNTTCLGSPPDWNKYDVVMKGIAERIALKRGWLQHGTQKSYIIGAVKGSKGVIKHEIAHALYSIYPEYKKEMDKLYSRLSSENKKYLMGDFKALGYAKSVWKDEAQAYLSTGDYFTSEERKPFANLLNKFIKHLDKSGKKSK